MAVFYEIGNGDVKAIRFAIPLFKFFYMQKLCNEIYNQTSPSSLKPVRLEQSMETFVKQLIENFDIDQLIHNRTRSIKDQAIVEVPYDRFVYFSLSAMKIESISPQLQALEDGKVKGSKYKQAICSI